MLNHQFSRDNWVFPEYLYSRHNRICVCGEFYDDAVKFKNSGLRILLSPENPSVWATWRGGSSMLGGNCVGVESNDRVMGCLEIGIRNFLSIVTEYPPENGYLQGTFKLLPLYDTGFELVPEDTEENKFKEDISVIWRDSRKPFTSKMKPGHLYIGKAKTLFLCIDPEVDLYTEKGLLPCNLQYYWSLMYRYKDDNPRKAKLIMKLWEQSSLMEGMRAGTFKSIQDVMIGDVTDISLYSPQYAGKDLGPVLTDDGRKLGDILDLLPDSLLNKIIISASLINRNFENSPRVKQALIDYITENSIKGNNGELGKLFRRLGI